MAVDVLKFDALISADVMGNRGVGFTDLFKQGNIGPLDTRAVEFSALSAFA